MVHFFYFLWHLNHCPETVSRISNSEWRVQTICAQFCGLSISSVKSKVCLFIFIPWSNWEVCAKVSPAGVCRVDTKCLGVSGAAHKKWFSILPQAHRAYVSTSPVNPEDFSVVLRARKRIEEGEEITIHYVSPMMGLIKRKQSIEEEWYFKCRWASHW